MKATVKFLESVTLILFVLFLSLAESTSWLVQAAFLVAALFFVALVAISRNSVD
jgi:uncharacterized membrane protein SirB2